MRYGLAAVQTTEELPEPPEQINILAQHYLQYLQEIQKIQPTGPYFLCGRSLGGLVAFEMACQLEQQGEQIGFLGLLNTFHPLHSICCPVSFAKRLFYSLTKRPSRFVERLRQGFFSYHLQQRTWLEACINAWQDAWHVSAAKIKRGKFPYRPPAYSGKVGMFESQEYDGLGAARWGWEQCITGKFEIISIPGGKDELM